MKLITLSCGTVLGTPKMKALEETCSWISASLANHVVTSLQNRWTKGQLKRKWTMVS